MKYLVMDCGLSYAVVLDSEGRFLKVANLGYEVGQTVDRVVEFAPPKPAWRMWKRIVPLAAAAACVVLVAAAGLLLIPYGTVRIQINPDVMLWVNRTSHVVRMEGMNEDGRCLIDGYSAFGKPMEEVSNELADRAIQQGYLKDGGSVALTVDSQHEQWKTAAAQILLLELEVHLDNRVQIVTEQKNEQPPASVPHPTPALVLPADDSALSQEDEDDRSDLDDDDDSDPDSEPDDSDTDEPDQDD